MKTLCTFTDPEWYISGIDGAYPTLTIGGDTTWTMVAPLDTLINYTLTDILNGYTYNGNNIALSSLWSTASIFNGTEYDNLVYGTDYVFMRNGGTVSSLINAGTYSDITIDVLKSGYNEASTGNVSGSLVIDKKALSASLTGTITKEYNGDTAATLTSQNYSLDGLVEGESLTVNKTTATYNSKNVATATTAETTLAEDNFGAGENTLLANYVLPTTANGTASIIAKEITVTATAADKTYDALTSATATLASSGIIGEDAVTFDGTATFDTKDVGADKTVTVATLTKIGDDAANYTISNATALALADITATPEPEPEPTPVAQNIDSIIQFPKVEIPQFVPAVNYVSNNLFAVSSAPENTPTQIVSMSELKTIMDDKQTNEGGVNPSAQTQTRIPLGKNSIIELVNGGVNLPAGVEQEFYIVRADTSSNADKKSTKKSK